jgi:hypothetical protein
VCITAFHHAQEKWEMNLKKIIFIMIQDFSFVDKEELLTAEEWQHVEAMN